MQEEIQLKVSEAFQQDVWYGRARIDHQTRIDLDLSIGDVIEIEGNKTTAASVWRAHPSDEGKRIIRIDNLTRKNAGSGLGERVKVRLADVKEAREVVLAPLMPIVLALSAAIMGVALAAGAVKRAWEQEGDLIKDTISGAFTQAKDAIKKALTYIITAPFKLIGNL